MHDGTRRHQAAVARMLQIIRELEILPPDFPFTTIQVLHNAVVRRHRDKNEGLSTSVSFGQFSGGLLALGEEGAEGLIDIFQLPLTYDGNIQHYVTPHGGGRWSPAFFTLKDYHKLVTRDLAFLRDLGFNILGAEAPP